MKIEIGEKRPENFVQYWEGQYDIFHHFEYACGIPSVLFAITTRKENGKSNVNYANGLDGKYEDNGFMLNIHAPKSLKTGEGKPSAVAVCKIVRINEDG